MEASYLRVPVLRFYAHRVEREAYWGPRQNFEGMGGQSGEIQVQFCPIPRPHRPSQEEDYRRRRLKGRQKSMGLSLEYIHDLKRSTHKQHPQPPQQSHV